MSADEKARVMKLLRDRLADAEKRAAFHDSVATARGRAASFKTIDARRADDARLDASAYRIALAEMEATP